MARRHHPILRFVLLVVTHPRLTLAVTLLLAGVSVALAVWRLDISSDQNKLFSEDVPFFRDFLEFDRKFPENEAAYVLIRARGDEKSVPITRWTGAADAIAKRLSALTQYVHSVDARIPLDQLGQQALLFEETAQVRKAVEEVRTRFIPLVRLFAERPSRLTALLGPTPLDQFLAGLTFRPPADDEARFTALLARSWTRTLNAPATQSSQAVNLPDLASLDASDPYALGYYYLPDETDRSHHVLLIRVYPRVDFASLTAASESVEAMRAAVREAMPAYPEFIAGVTGRPALNADEMRTTDQDSHRAEVVALTAVFIGIVVLLRSLWLALAAELALGVGIAWTFGWATLTLGELNLLSIVFLLALIGIGMDYLVQVLSRYRAEATRRRDPRTIWVAVFRQVGPPINTACLGAAGAFLVSLFTDFEGAADLGLIAGGGLILCLLAGYTFLPALLTLFPVRTKEKMEDGGWKMEGKAIQTPSSILHPPSSSSTLRRWTGPVLWTLLLLAGIPFARRTGFNPSLLELQATKLESVRLIRKLQTWSAVVLSNDLDALRSARDALKPAPTVARLESVLTAYDNYHALTREISPLPSINWTPPAAIQPNAVLQLANKADALAAHFQAAPGRSAPCAEAAAAIREFATTFRKVDPANAAARLSAWQVAFVAELKRMLAQFQPAGPPDLAKVPTELRNHFVSPDGTYALYVWPKQDLWQIVNKKQENLSRFVRDVEARTKPLPQLGTLTLTGIAHNIYHSTSAIRRSFYRATFYALGLILLLVWIDLRRVSHTLLAVSVLGLGLPMLVALMGLLGVDWNFANFFGLPILIGAGHEYGVFLVHRYRESLRDRHRTWGRWDVADGALLLCAFITSSSFGFFFLLAHHRGLRSLGLVMALGTACIYLASVAAVRPVLKWRLAKAQLRECAGPIEEIGKPSNNG